MSTDWVDVAGLEVRRVEASGVVFDDEPIVQIADGADIVQVKVENLPALILKLQTLTAPTSVDGTRFVAHGLVVVDQVEHRWSEFCSEKAAQDAAWLLNHRHAETGDLPWKAVA